MESWLESESSNYPWESESEFQTWKKVTRAFPTALSASLITTPSTSSSSSSLSHSHTEGRNCSLLSLPPSHTHHALHTSRSSHRSLIHIQFNSIQVFAQKVKFSPECCFHFLLVVKLRRSRDGIFDLHSSKINSVGGFRRQTNIKAKVIKVTELISEARWDIWGC